MKERRFFYYNILFLLILLSSCSMSIEDKKEKSDMISSNLKMIVDSLFSSRNIKVRDLKHWTVNYHMLKRSTDVSNSYELPFEFDLCNSKNPREYYTFDGVVIADSHNLKVRKNKEGEYIVRMNILFHGDSGQKYTVDYFNFPDFEEVTSVVSKYDSTLNVPMTKYYGELNTEKTSFLKGMSDNEQAIALLRFRERMYNGCSFKFNGNWLEITMESNQYPINAGTPEVACKEFFEENKDLLKYCTGVRIYNDGGAKLGSYRNPNDHYNQ